MRIKGAVFDLDGTLLETEQFQWKGWVEALLPHGVSLPKGEYHHYAGKNGRIIEKELVAKHGLNIRPGAILEKKEALLEKWFETEGLVRLHYAKEALEFFGSRGLKLALASSAPRHETVLKLKRAGLYQVFDVIVARDDVKEAKPLPEMYIFAVKKLGLEPSDCVAFEDTESGVRSAKAAGLVCFAVPNEFTQKQDFSQADAIFANLEKAIEHVKRIYGL